VWQTLEPQVQESCISYHSGPVTLMGNFCLPVTVAEKKIFKAIIHILVKTKGKTIKSTIKLTMTFFPPCGLLEYFLSFIH